MSTRGSYPCLFKGEPGGKRGAVGCPVSTHWNAPNWLVGVKYFSGDPMMRMKFPTRVPHDENEHPKGAQVITQVTQQPTLSAALNPCFHLPPQFLPSVGMPAGSL